MSHRNIRIFGVLVFYIFYVIAIIYLALMTGPIYGYILFAASFFFGTLLTVLGLRKLSRQ